MATTAKTKTVEQCPECGAEATDDGTEAVCPECGLVIEESPVDHGPEWRNFEGEEKDRERTHTRNENRDDRGLGSHISRSFDDDLQMTRMRQLSGQMSKKARGKDYGTSEVERMAGCLELSDSIADQGTALFRQFHEAGECKGRNYDAVAAACLFAACRVNQAGVLAEDIVEYARDVEYKILMSRYKDLKNALSVPIPPPDPRSRIRRIAGELDVSTSRVEWALTQFDQIPDKKQCRGSPTTIAAACVYLACGGHRGRFTQKEVAEAADCTATSIRDRLQDIPGLNHR